MPRYNSPCNTGLTFTYKTNDTCEICTIPLKMSITHDKNLVWSKGIRTRSEKLCITCAIRKGLVTEADIENKLGLIRA